MFLAIESPGDVVDSVPTPVFGRPDRKRICTSHIERQNLSIRMGMRRMTRLTISFSKKWENLQAAYSLWFAFYNFCRAHMSLGKGPDGKGRTPAMAAGVESRKLEIADLIALLPDSENAAGSK